MQTKTLDSLVRETLESLGLTTHFYVDLLMYGLQELQRLHVHHQSNVKQVRLTINGYNRVPIPSDCLYILDISIMNGERILSAARDRNLNRMYNFDSDGNKIAFPDPAEESDENFSLVDFIDDYFDDRNRYGFGGFFGIKNPQEKVFNVDYQNSEIIFSNEFEDDEVVITYASDPVSQSTISLVRFEFWEVIRRFMRKEFMIRDKYYNQYDKEKEDDEYRKAKRNMKALVYPVSEADLMYSIRRGIHGSIKN